MARPHAGDAHLVASRAWTVVRDEGYGRGAERDVVALRPVVVLNRMRHRGLCGKRIVGIREAIEVAVEVAELKVLGETGGEADGADAVRSVDRVYERDRADSAPLQLEGHAPCGLVRLRREVAVYVHAVVERPAVRGLLVLPERHVEREVWVAGVGVEVLPPPCGGRAGEIPCAHIEVVGRLRAAHVRGVHVVADVLVLLAGPGSPEVEVLILRVVDGERLRLVVEVYGQVARGAVERDICFASLRDRVEYLVPVRYAVNLRHVPGAGLLGRGEAALLPAVLAHDADVGDLAQVVRARIHEPSPHVARRKLHSPVVRHARQCGEVRVHLRDDVHLLPGRSAGADARRVVRRALHVG